MKRLLKIFAVLAVLGIVAVTIFVFTGLGHAIKAVVEGVGSRATGTTVTLKSADVSLSNGDGRLTGLVVGNPKGYGTPSAFELGDIHVTLDTSTVMSDTIVLKEVVIDAPVVTYELGPGGSNVGVIQANVDAFTKGFGGGSSDEKKPSSDEKKPASAPADKSGKKFVIEDLYIKSGNIGCSASFLGGKKVCATLAEIHLHNLGKAEGGATSGEIAQEVLGALTKGVTKSISDLGIGPLTDGLNALKGQGGTLLEKAKGLLGGKK